MSRLRPFVGDENGAVTVDWMVLSAAAIGLGLVAMAVFSTVLGATIEDIGTNLGVVMKQASQ